MPRLGFARREQRRDGYVRWRSWDGDRERYCYVHRLLATLLETDDGGFIPLDEFDGHHVHHRNAIRWDNRLENLELQDPNDHAEHHLHGRDLPEAEYTGDVDIPVIADGGEQA